jgi:hypothetical protein
MRTNAIVVHKVDKMAFGQMLSGANVAEQICFAAVI